ncbi:hypothetical protein [Anoxybacillus sp. B7M1]|uniref:hypothetical protein n=1 Tax=unclassified Anoxybacillus TaxID=2639704 RepID=UPI001E612EC2|nr:hypothetical protein [Anoxybacillus sp. B7M1]
MIQDLPIADQPVQLLLISRKWVCDDSSCSVQVFTERYDWLAPPGRLRFGQNTLCDKWPFPRVV